MTFIKKLLHRLKELFNMVFKRSVYRHNTCYEPVYASSENKEPANHENETTYCSDTNSNVYEYDDSADEDTYTQEYENEDTCNKDTNEFVTSYCSEMNSNVYEWEVVNDTHAQECTNDVSNDEEHTCNANDSVDNYTEDFSDVENKAAEDYGFFVFDKYGMRGMFGTPKPTKFDENREYRIIYPDPDSLVKLGLYYRDDTGRLVLTKPMKGTKGLSEYCGRMMDAKFKCARKFWPDLAKFMKENFIEHAYVIFDDTGEPIANVYSDAPELKFTY